MPQVNIVEVSREDITDIGEFTTDTLVGINSGINSRKKVVVNPRGDIVMIADENYSLVSHPAILEAVENVLRERDMLPQATRYFLSENMSRMEVDWRFSAEEEILAGDKINPALILYNDMGDGGVGFELGSYRQVCANGLVAFVSLIHLRKQKTLFVNPDSIVQSLTFAIQQWEDTTLPKYRAMANDLISREEALERISHIGFSSVERDQAVLEVERAFNDDASPDGQLTRWQLFNVYMYIATHLIERKRRMGFNRKVINEFSPAKICYHGTPHPVTRR